MPQIATISLLKPQQEIECSSFRNSVDDIVAITARCSYGSNPTQELRISIFYSPDGKNYDNIPFTFFDVDYKASATQQKCLLQFQEIMVVMQDQWQKVGHSMRKVRLQQQAIF